ncbi:MAG: NAD(P)/FAD-dependent oxidoreductase [Planctomycetota bacterium]
MTEKIAVIGGGISGLSAAYFALKKGNSVDLFEGAGRLGGLAASFDFNGLNIEKYYHFICGNDFELVNFAEELGIGDKLHFRPSKLSFFYNGKFYRFGSPLNLLRFSPISLLSRIRFGLNVVSSKYTKDWEKLDEISAKEWLTKKIGRHAYQVIWYPLLKVKFGEYYDYISAAWIWHRIHRVATSRKGIFSKEKLGYFDGGSQTLVDATEKKIKAMGGHVFLKSKVMGIEKIQDRYRLSFGSEEPRDYDKIVLAVPLPVAASLVEKLNPDYADRLAGIDFIGVVCGIFRLKQPVSDAFWLNINDPRTPSNGLIEYTNLNPLKEIAPHSIAYIPFYMPVKNPWFSRTEKDLKAEFVHVLKTIKPDIRDDAIIDFRVFKSRHAQAICTMGFQYRVPKAATPLSNLFLIDSTQLYPSDRSLSGLIGLAEKLADQWL